MRAKRWARRLGFAVLLLIAIAATVLGFPDPWFRYARDHRGFEVHSDAPIDPKLDGVLDEVRRRLQASPLYWPDDRFRIFICTQPWRLWLWTRNPSVGGVTDVAFTRNIYLRSIDAAANRIVIPPSWGPLLDAPDRPLSYFIAHEATHVLQSRRYGRMIVLRRPRWLIEGYADLVGKGGRFDVKANRELLRAGDPLLGEAYGRHGLYRRYHLMVLAQLRRPGITVNRLFADPPSEAVALRAAEAGSP